MRVLIIDNYDSFTFNLYQYIGEILISREFRHGGTSEVIVKRNDEIGIADIKTLAPERIILSPGAGRPEDDGYFGVCRDAILQLGQHTRMLGVCLGMQGIAHCFGGRIVHAPLPMHGKVTSIQHNDSGIFHHLPQGMEVMRYHSLMVDPATLPDCLEITSTVGDAPVIGEDMLQQALAGREIMAIKHRQYPIEGVQFHPESFATEGARALLSNFLRPRPRFKP